MKDYYRPIPSSDVARPASALTLAGGWTWFDRVELLRRGEAPQVVSAMEVPDSLRERMTTTRLPVAGVEVDIPRLMGILNTTPDSFSDGGEHNSGIAALARARLMAEEVDIVDIGGESTRPGAAEVSLDEEIARTAPVIRSMRQAGLAVPVSIDTRKAPVARAALTAGAGMVNDVSGLEFDADLAPLVAEAGVPLCLMHAIETPATMQDNPTYDDVLLDVYDALERRIAMAESAGISRSAIVVDPGIGFGKSLAHNLALLARVSLFHTLGCPILLGASRKRFIGTIAQVPDARARAPGSIAVALAAIGQGVQILRVHDTAETLQALRLFAAATSGFGPEETV